MKTTNNFYYMLLAFVFLCVFMYCGGNGPAGESRSDTATATRIDSVNATLHDPASETTTPPVTGNQTDSSRIKDSAHRKH